MIAGLLQRPLANLVQSEQVASQALYSVSQRLMVIVRTGASASLFDSNSRIQAPMSASG
jgi:hypothetical protein